jgi:putative addiction module component (TIGR02574 family)
MGEGAKKLLSQALQLPLEERAQLAADLLASIDGEPDEDVDAAWAAEIERRAARALAGKSEGRPWREALRRLDPERGK